MSIIKSFSVGNGDLFYIRHNSDNFTMIDCNLISDRRNELISELKDASNGKCIQRFISTHPDEDHIHGLEFIDDNDLGWNFYCVENNVNKDEETPSFKRYKALRNDPKRAYHISKGCERRWMNLSSEERGSAGISILWPDVCDDDFLKQLASAEQGGTPNNISPIIKYSLENGVVAIWMGDLEKSFMEKIEEKVSIGSADILFAPHHGRSSGRPPRSWLDSIDPGLVVIGEADCEVVDYYRDYTHICQNTAGDILFDCVRGWVHIYAANPYKAKGLIDLNKESLKGLSYMGSMVTKDR